MSDNSPFSVRPGISKEPTGKVPCSTFKLNRDFASLNLPQPVPEDHKQEKTAERWDVGKRIRDVEQGPDGSLWMLEDANPGALIHVTPK